MRKILPDPAGWFTRNSMALHMKLVKLVLRAIRIISAIMVSLKIYRSTSSSKS